MKRLRLNSRQKEILEQIRVRTHYRESSETLSLVASAVLVGLLAGFSAVAFDRVVHYMGLGFAFFRGQLGGTWGSVVAVLIPVIGGVLITPIVVNWSPDTRGSGIPGVMFSVSNLAGRMPKRIMFWRPIASGISIGTGASLGSEGPIVQLTVTVASFLGDLMKLNEERRRSLAGVAVAGGIAATFNAPIAGVLFALEVVLGKFTNKYFGAVVIGAVAASAVSRTILGPAPAFVVPDYALNSILELPLYFVLGIAAAFVSIAIIVVMVKVENGFARLSLPKYLRPAFGGLLIGLLGLVLPGVLGRGYEETGLILSGELVGGGILIVIMFAKMLAMSISLAAWHSGGIFGPILLIGAAFGAAFGQLSGALFPALELNPGAFALVGMAAVFAGAERAPMSTIVMIFEMSNDYQLILPLLLAAVLATLIADIFHPESIYHVMLSRRGMSLLRLRESDLLQTVTVREILDPEIPSLFADETLKTFGEKLVSSHHHGFVVRTREDPEHILGIITLSDLERARQSGATFNTPVREFCQRTVHCALPDESISEVLERMAHYKIGRMPVVDPNDRRMPIGFVRQSDLARAYYQAVQNHRQLEENEETRRLRDLTGQEIVEIKVRSNCPLVGRPLKEIRFPKESIIVSIRRQGKTVFPHGDTSLQAGDTVVANVAAGFANSFRQYFVSARQLNQDETNKS